jgi:hypothetical protein
MSALFDPGKEAVRHERAMSSLRDRTGVPLAEVRSLFEREFARLELGAKVRSYLAVLTASNVRGMLPRKGAPDAASSNSARDDPHGGQSDGQT